MGIRRGWAERLRSLVHYPCDVDGPGQTDRDAVSTSPLTDWALGASICLTYGAPVFVNVAEIGKAVLGAAAGRVLFRPCFFCTTPWRCGEACEGYESSGRN